MSAEIPADAIVLGRIEVVRFIDSAGRDIVGTHSESSSGELVPLVEAFGMLRMAEDIITQMAMGETDEDQNQDDDDV